VAKLILILIIGFTIYALVRGYLRRLPKEDAKPQTGSGEDMVRCSRCGVHLPRSESLLADGKFYCSEEHRLGSGSGN
jgi:uncharacterized protein